jgi:hypothetical protein
VIHRTDTLVRGIFTNSSGAETGISVNPNVAKAGGLQRQGAKGAAVVGYCKPLATPDLKSSGFPEG